MQQILQNQTLRSAGAVASTMGVAIIYEDFESGKQAKRTYDYLAGALSHQTHLTNSMWKFDVLGIPKLREIAARDAAAAEVVIVACHGGKGLPSHVRAWAEQWLTLNGKSTALVGLFDCSGEQARGVRAELEHIASRGNLDFFSQPQVSQPAPRRQPKGDSECLLHPEERTLDALQDAMRMEVHIPRWGINE